MSYYATAQTTTGRRSTAFLVGPFNRHGDAVRASELARDHLRQHSSDYRDAAAITWAAHGTARIKTSALVERVGLGRLNGVVGYSGRVSFAGGVS